jgi:hypothetical protein
MMKQSKIRKKTVELSAPARPSRIRRDPKQVEMQTLVRGMWWQSREWEIRFAVIGIILFALAINFVSVGFSAITSH